MGDENRNESDADAGGVFGKLPKVRPGTRSPRRRGAKAKSEGREAGSTPESGRAQPAAAQRSGKADRSGAAAAAPRAATASPGDRSAGARGPGPESPPPTPPAAAERPEAPARRDNPGVEDLAWAGITVAAEAATLGVRLLSRAVEVVRKPADTE